MFRVIIIEMKDMKTINLASKPDNLGSFDVYGLKEGAATALFTKSALIVDGIEYGVEIAEFSGPVDDRARLIAREVLRRGDPIRQDIIASDRLHTDELTWKFTAAPPVVCR